MKVLKNDTNVLIVLSIFPNDNFLSGNFPRVMLGPMWSRSLQLGRALRLEQARGPQALRLGIDRLGKFTLGKMHSWEVVSWKKTPLGSCHLEKTPFGSCHLEKTPLKSCHLENKHHLVSCHFKKHPWEVGSRKNAFGKVANKVLIGSAVSNKIAKFKIKFAYLEHALHSKSWNSTELKVVKQYDILNQQTDTL